MSIPLDLGDELIDKGKSSLMLYYLAKATQKQIQREIAHRKVELSIKQLKKISTKNLHKHIDELQGHVAEAIHREKEIQTRQKSEEEVHHDLKQKIGRLETKLGRYMDTQEQRKQRIQELEDKIKQKFQTKKEKIKLLKEDLMRLQKILQTARKTKGDRARLNLIEERIRQIKEKISIL